MILLLGFRTIESTTEFNPEKQKLLQTVSSQCLVVAVSFTFFIGYNAAKGLP